MNDPETERRAANLAASLAASLAAIQSGPPTRDLPEVPAAVEEAPAAGLPAPQEAPDPIPYVPEPLPPCDASVVREDPGTGQPMTEVTGSLIISGAPRKLRRIGVFRLTFDFVDAFSDILGDIMLPLWVLHMDTNFASRVIEYTAESTVFEEVPLGEYPPTYVAKFRLVDETIEFEGWEKVCTGGAMADDCERVSEVEKIAEEKPRPEPPPWFAEAHAKAVEIDSATLRADLEAKAEAIKEGFGGITREGRIVDRRQHPEADPLAENTFLGTPAPRPVLPVRFEVGPEPSTGNEARDAMRENRGISSNS